MPVLELTVDCGGGNSLSTSFRFTDGRYRHSIILRKSDGAALDQWEDEANSGDEDWPASPPIQQLSLESINDRPTLLGVGQAGKSHWSISVETILGSPNPLLKFDLACRCRSQPVWLGSSYRRLPSMVELEPKLFLTPFQPSTTNPQPLGVSLRASLTFSKPFQPTTIANRLLIANCELDQAPIPKYPTTFRWTYFVHAEA